MSDDSEADEASRLDVGYLRPVHLFDQPTTEELLHTLRQSSVSRLSPNFGVVVYGGGKFPLLEYKEVGFLTYFFENDLVLVPYNRSAPQTKSVDLYGSTGNNSLLATDNIFSIWDCFEKFKYVKVSTIFITLCTSSTEDPHLAELEAGLPFSVDSVSKMVLIIDEPSYGPFIFLFKCNDAPFFSLLTKLADDLFTSLKRACGKDENETTEGWKRFRDTINTYVNQPWFVVAYIPIMRDTITLGQFHNEHGKIRWMSEEEELQSKNRISERNSLRLSNFNDSCTKLKDRLDFSLTTLSFIACGINAKENDKLTTCRFLNVTRIEWRDPILLEQPIPIALAIMFPMLRYLSIEVTCKTHVDMALFPNVQILQLFLLQNHSHRLSFDRESPREIAYLKLQCTHGTVEYTDQLLIVKLVLVDQVSDSMSTALKERAQRIWENGTLSLRFPDLLPEIEEVDGSADFLFLDANEGADDSRLSIRKRVFQLSKKNKEEKDRLLKVKKDSPHPPSKKNKDNLSSIDHDSQDSVCQSCCNCCC